LFSFRYPFKPYRKNTTFDDDDDEDEYVDIHDDVEDEVIDAEKMYNPIQLDNNTQSNENNNVIISSDIVIPSPVLPTTLLDEDEFISDDEELNSFSSDLLTLTDNEKKQLFEALHKTHALLLQTRKLVKIIRSISAIDQYVRNHPDGPDNGLIVDVRVSSTSYT
jgi:hypothetical protein